jgi:hypothetical protein
VDEEIGVAVIDRFTFTALEYLQSVRQHPDRTLQDFVDSWNVDFLGSDPVIRSHGARHPEDILLTDFFGNRQKVHFTKAEGTGIAVDEGRKPMGQTGQMGRPGWALLNPRLIVDLPEEPALKIPIKSIKL